MDGELNLITLGLANFFGCAFFVRQKDHVSFDIVFYALPAKFQKILTVATALIIISAMLYSFGPI